MGDLTNEGVGEPFPAAPMAVRENAATRLGFEEFYAASFQGIATQLYAYTGDLDQAHELVQEAFCRAFARWSKLQGYDDPAAWVRRVAFNLANSRWRRLKTATAYLRKQRVEHVVGPSPDRVTAIAAIALLPETQRRAVVLHYLADLSVAEIAEQEGVAVGTVKSWLHRGRAALAAHIGADGKEATGA
jgi:RNA polymerase sigma-70 factor (ECF subfamily)